MSMERYLKALAYKAGADDRRNLRAYGYGYPIGDDKGYMRDYYNGYKSVGEKGELINAVAVAHFAVDSNFGELALIASDID